METIYPLVLYYILCFPGISTQALLAVHKRAATVYHAVQKGLANNHIVEYTLKHNRHVTKYLVLTPSGIWYLQERSARLALCSMLDRIHGYAAEPWWSNRIVVLTSDDFRFRVSGMSTEYVLRVCGVSSSNLFWNAVGASTAVTLLPESINSPYCDEIRSALTCMYLHDLPSPFQYNKKGLVYEDAFSVKDRLAEVAAPELARAGRYSGVLITDHTAITVYVGHKDGMSWAPLAAKRDLDAMHVYSKKLSPLEWDYSQKYHGILLVKSPKMFFDLLCDSAGKNRDRRGRIKYKLGKGFASFVIVPGTYQGVKLAQRYISAEPETAVKNLTQQIQMSFFPEARISRPNQINIDRNGISIYQMIFMDSVAIYSLIQTHPKASFDILCLDWQADYYTKVFDFLEIKDNFILDDLNIVHATARVKPEIASLLSSANKSAMPKTPFAYPYDVRYVP